MSQETTEKNLLTTQVLQHRLQIGLGVAGGARGSLTKCAGQVLAGSTTTDWELQRVELIKLVLMAQRNEREIQQLQEESQQQDTIKDDQQLDLPRLRAALARKREVRSCYDEYEAVAKITVGRHDTSEETLTAELLEMEHTYARLQQDDAQVSAERHVRTNQLHLLQSCLVDLRESLRRPVALDAQDIEDAKMKEPEKAPEEEEEEEEEGEELYDDL